jgi:hypothetical protein
MIATMGRGRWLVRAGMAVVTMAGGRRHAGSGPREQQSQRDNSAGRPAIGFGPRRFPGIHSLHRASGFRGVASRNGLRLHSGMLHRPIHLHQGDPLIWGLYDGIRTESPKSKLHH